ncbi:hypothetical protein [Paenibacillus apiarius]|uniref:hypothetical protein n=1 Tax=Paenibacillus apiarius TaxID=46240 RepID=UPI003B3B0C95
MNQAKLVAGIFKQVANKLFDRLSERMVGFSALSRADASCVIWIRCLASQLNPIR